MKRRDFLKVACGGAATAALPVTGEARDNLPVPEKAYGMLYDATLCIGCKACMVKCKEVNDLPPETDGANDNADFTKGLSGKTLNVIKVYRNGTAEKKDAETDGFSFVKRHCMHCVDAGCVSVCPVSAMRKDPETGVVSHHPDACIGCRYCVYACPYNVPQYDYSVAYGQIHKCQFCNQQGVERLDKGLLPGCVEVCPTGASLFGTRDEMLAEAKRRLSLKPGDKYRYPRERVTAGKEHEKTVAAPYQQKVYGEKQGGGTQVLHIAGVPFEKLGLPDLPERSYASISETVQHTLYSGMLAPVALLAGLTYTVRKNLNKDDDDQSGSNKGE